MCWAELSLGRICHSLDHSRNSRRAIRGSSRDTGPEEGIFCRAPGSAVLPGRRRGDRKRDKSVKLRKG